MAVTEEYSHRIFVAGEGPCTVDAVMDAEYQLAIIMVKLPALLRLSPCAWNDLRTNAVAEDGPYMLESLFGFDGKGGRYLREIVGGWGSEPRWELSGPTTKQTTTREGDDNG